MVAIWWFCLLGGVPTGGMRETGREVGLKGLVLFSWLFLMRERWDFLPLHIEETLKTDPGPPARSYGPFPLGGRPDSRWNIHPSK